MAQDFKISDALRDTVLTHPDIEEVHFTADGHHHFATPEVINGKRYLRVDEVKSQIKTAQGLAAKIVRTGVPHTEVIKTFTRDEILN